MGIAAASLYLACISTGEIKSQKKYLWHQELQK